MFLKASDFLGFQYCICRNHKWNMNTICLLHFSSLLFLLAILILAILTAPSVICSPVLNNGVGLA